MSIYLHRVREVRHASRIATVRTRSVRAYDSHTGVQSNINVHLLQEDLFWSVPECHVVQLQKRWGYLVCFWESIHSSDKPSRFKG